MTLRGLGRRYPWLVRAAVGVLQAVALVATLVEAPIFLARRRALRNPHAFVFWMWSFGHTLLGLDYASRLYHGHRISLIYVPDPRSNVYLAHCFGHSLDVFVFESVLTPLLARLDRWLNLFPVRRVQYRVLRFWVLVCSAVTDRFQPIDQVAGLYDTLNMMPGGRWAGNAAGDALVRSVDVTGYARLLEAGIGEPPRMPHELRERCRAAIAARCPTFLDRPFVTLLLKRKGLGSADLSDAVRCAGPQENYLPAVRHLTERGYHVVGAGETDHAVFAGVPGYHALEGVDLPPRLLNLFVLMHCALYIGQASGPNWMGSTVGFPSLVCDGVLYSGTFRPTDLVLHKPLYEVDTGRRLSLVELYRDHVDLVLGYNYARKGIQVGHNSGEEILEAVKESLALLEGRLELTEADRRLCERYRALVPPEAIVKYQGNRPPLFVLRELEKELLEES